MHTETADQITCKNCGIALTGRYCRQCGEKRYTEHDRTVKHFIEEGLHFLTHFEGTFFTTMRYIFTRPGKLSADYCYGIRKPLFKPLSLFLLLCIVYLLFPVFEGLNMRLHFHLQAEYYGGYAKKEVAAILQAHNWTEGQLAEAFQKQSTKVSKFLLLILLPLTALFFWPLTFKKRRLFFDQMVFATEINSFYLIWGFLILPLLVYLFQIGHQAITGRQAHITDGGVGMVMYALLLVYAGVASRRFYGLKTWEAIVITLLFYFAHPFIVQTVYKFILFFVSIKLVH